MYFADTQYIINPLTDYLSPSKLSVSKLAHFVMGQAMPLLSFVKYHTLTFSHNFAWKNIVVFDKLFFGMYVAKLSQNFPMLKMSLFNGVIAITIYPNS